MAWDVDVEVTRGRHALAVAARVDVEDVRVTGVWLVRGSRRRPLDVARMGCVFVSDLERCALSQFVGESASRDVGA